MDKFFYDKILNIFFPAKCGFCDAITGNSNYICDKCQKLKYISFDNRCVLCGGITYNLNGICKKCSGRKIYYEKLLYIGEYEGVLKEKLLAYKFKDKAYFYNFFAELLSVKILQESADILTVVPISRKRFFERGYNQSELIGRKVSKYLEKPYKNLLVKNHETLRQSELSKNERFLNVKNTFGVKNKDFVKNKNIILIDDIFTTGATINECSKMLKNAGAKSVVAVVIAVNINK